MRVFRGLPKSSDAPLALTIGNFDGVHRGHQAMLTRLIEGAEDLRLVPAALTFEPHPREFFAPDSAPPLPAAETAEEVACNEEPATPCEPYMAAPEPCAAAR